MTTFSYTTGNPSNLTAGATASMNDIQGPFTDLRTFLNGANLDTSNLATTAKPSTLLGAYETVQETYSTAVNSVADTFRIRNSSGAVGDVGSGLDHEVMWLDPAQHTIAGLTTQLRLFGTLATNNVAPTGTWFVALRPVTTIGGGATLLSVTGIGAALGQVQVAGSPPSANAVGAGTSADFAFPTAGPYAFTVHVTGASQAANSRVGVRWTLQKHYI